MNHVFCSLDIRVSPNFAHICQQLSKAKFQAIFVTDASNSCKERKIKLF